MHGHFENVYADEARASAYAALEFAGTYYLAFRDIPQLLHRHVRGTTALDFGCGAGRSTRFLQGLGYDAIGVDISDAMLREARRRDPDGAYHLLPDGRLDLLGEHRFDLVLCAFPFDNIPGRASRVDLFRQLGGRLAAGGRIINLVSAPELYVHDWVSFSTSEFPGNRSASPGEVVRVTMLDVPDRRPVADLLWTESDYRETYAAAGLEVVDVHRPLGVASDPYEWTIETHVSPWTIWVLAGTG